MDEDGAPVVRAESALECLPPYDPNRHSGNGSPGSFLYWTIRDYAHAYRSRHVTPSMVSHFDYRIFFTLPSLLINL